MKRAARRSPAWRAPARRPAAGDRLEMIRRLRELRRLARELRRKAAAPVIERVGQIIETECHLALWSLGDVHGMTPEDERRR
jgi:hypothetical protein